MADPPGLDDIAADREHGASELMGMALDAVQRRVHAGDAPDEREVLDLVRAHPAMAPMVHLAADLLEAPLDPDRVRTIRARHDRRRRRLREHGLTAIRDGARVATLSRSGSVLGALLGAHELGTLEHVHLARSRPGDEALSAAAHLREAGVPVEVVPDADLVDAVGGGQPDLVLVGADTICLEGVVNKVGTRRLLAAARAGGVPGLVLAGLDKVLPAAVAPAPALGRGEGRDLFELVPADRVPRIVTDEHMADGPAPTVEALARAASVPRHVAEAAAAAITDG